MTMRQRFALVSLVLLLGGCGGGGQVKTHQLAVNDRWDYARTITTIQNGSTTTNQANVTWRVTTAFFNGQNRLAFNYSPNDMAVEKLVVSQDGFSHQVDIIGTTESGIETTQASTYLPGTIQTGATFPTLIITTDAVIPAVASVGAMEKVTVRAGSYQAYKITASSGGTTVTSWVRPEFAAPVKQVIVEVENGLTRTTDFQLTATSV